MKKLLFTLLLLTACSVTKQPEPLEEYLIYKDFEKPLACVDHLGCGNATYAKTAVRDHPAGSAFRCFTQKNLFGPKAYEVFDKAGASGKVPSFGFELNWSDNHSTSRKDFPKIIQEAKRFVPLVDKYSNIACEFTGITEHTLNQSDAKDLANMVLSVIPERCIYVNNPWVGKGSFIPTSNRIVNEVHGKSAQPPNIGGPFNWSADGDDIFDFSTTPVKNRMSGARKRCGWTSQNNGKRNASDKTPRPQRIYWPTPELIKMINFNMETNQGEVNLPKKYDVKPKADQHSAPPGERELKPVFIFPLKVDYIYLRGNGKEFKSSKGQPFADGRTRFYFADYGYQIVKKAGIPVLDVGYYKNKKWIKLGTTNPGFRQGKEYN